MCNTEIHRRGIYERDAEYIILSEVDAVTEDECTEKKALYYQKREEFLKVNKEREKRSKASSGTPPAPTEDNWGWALPFMALAVLVVIAFLRK